MDKKRRFDRANYIPNQDKSQRESFFSEAWKEALLGMGENCRRQQQLAEKKKVYGRNKEETRRATFRVKVCL